MTRMVDAVLDGRSYVGVRLARKSLKGLELMAEDTRGGAARTEARELLVRADSYLSLLWHRYVPDARKDADLRWHVERTISDLRKASTAALGAAGDGLTLEWQPIESAPKMRTILLFAVSDIAEDGTVRNWKMATGSYHTGYEDERSKERGYSPWEWGGHQLKVYELHPTHWMPLPAPPNGSHP